MWALPQILIVHWPSSWLLVWFVHFPITNKRLSCAKYLAGPWGYNPKLQTHDSATTNFHLFPCLHSWSLENSLELLSRNHFKLENENENENHEQSSVEIEKKTLGWKPDSWSSYPCFATDIWGPWVSHLTPQGQFPRCKISVLDQILSRFLSAIKFYVSKINVLAINSGTSETIFYQWLSNLMFINTVVWFSWPSLYHS